ncbi:hypothetical protein AB0K09_14445 [Streptomyces sp. NPDC049577]|uniref:hypothetical protein n=1 Tax=Streptomyces sp. NPDC049577 TaxID=3155153 RepID=UPI0034474526
MNENRGVNGNADDGEDEEPERGVVCNWCQGAGYITRALPYMPGTDPFGGPAETVHRAGQCHHCRGAGVYASEHDPTLEHWRSRRREEPGESAG